MGENAPFPRFAACGEDCLAALPATASSPSPSRGENGGLCPHPPKGPVPWVSLFENRPTSLASGMPSYGRKRALSPLRCPRRRPCSPARDRHIPPPSRGENGGLCPHPPKGPVPWVSLFGERPSSLASGMPSYGRKRALSPLRRLRRRPSCSPSRDRHIPPPSRGGERRALPAPAQGTSPLGIPFWEPAHISCVRHAVLWAKTRPFPASPPAAKTALQPLQRPPYSPRHSAGRTAGSARTRSRVQTLEDPFLGSGCHLPRLPRPPKRRRRQAPARGLAAVCALSRPRKKRKEAPMPPTRGAWARRPRAEGAGRPHCGHSRIFVTTPEPTVRPPSRIAKRRPSSHAIGVISVISMSMLSPGITISTPSGSLMLPVTSVVRK